MYVLIDFLAEIDYEIQNNAQLYYTTSILSNKLVCQRIKIARVATVFYTRAPCKHFTWVPGDVGLVVCALP